MDSTTPSTSSSSTTAAVDLAALCSCPKCHRRMSGLQFDLHTICETCRGIVCSLDTRCPECKPWSQEKMSAYLKHKVSLAGKRKKRQGLSTSSSPAVASSPSVDSHVRLPSVSEDSVIRDTVLSYLSSLSKSGSLGTNLPSFTAPSPVPDSAPSIKGVTGGESGPEPHNLGGPTRSSGVGAGVISSSAASIPTVLRDISVPLNVQPRVMQDVRADVSQPLAYASVPLASSGLDQPQFAGGDTVYVTAAVSLSPTSLLFSLPHPSSSSSSSSFSALPTSSSCSFLFLPPFFLPSFPTSSFDSLGLLFSSSSFLSGFSLFHCSLSWLSFCSFLFFGSYFFSVVFVSFFFDSLFFFFSFSGSSPFSSSWVSSSSSYFCLFFFLGLCFLFLLLFLRIFLFLLLLWLRLPLFLLPPLPLPLILSFRLG